MNVSLAGRAPATFEIKSANLPLVALLLKSADLAALGEELQARFGDIPDFFDNDPLLVDLTALAAEAEVDFQRLVALLKSYKLCPAAVKGGSPAQLRGALDAGLVGAQDAVPPRTVPEVKEAAPAPLPQPRAKTIFLDKPLRSGQRFYAKDADLVVLAMVNPGAEVIADGSIHVYAPLRGRAIAGARGDGQARIFSLALDPELVSIAGIYRTSEVALPAELLGKPAQVLLESSADAGKLVMKPLSP